MADLGLVFYGYTKDSADSIKGAYSQKLNKDIEIFGASESDNYRMEEILEDPDKNKFENGENKFLMFLGFDNDQISECLKFFPDGEERPVFCGLTENNFTWQVNYLMAHLIEEKIEARKQKIN